MSNAGSLIRDEARVVPGMIYQHVLHGQDRIVLTVFHSDPVRVALDAVSVPEPLKCDRWFACIDRACYQIE